MSKKMIGVPLEGFAQLCREAAAQGAVLEMRRIPYRLRTENAFLCSEGSRRIITEAGQVQEGR